MALNNANPALPVLQIHETNWVNHRFTAGLATCRSTALPEAIVIFSTRPSLAGSPAN